MKAEIKKLPFLPIIPGILLILAVLWFYWPVLAKLFDQLYNDEDYSYGLLLPLVSCYLIYLKWPKIREIPWRPSWMGMLMISLGFGLYLIGELAADLYLPRVSFIIVLAGMIFLVGGWKAVRFFGFPLILLVLMLPLPGLVSKQLTLPLQLVSSWLATDMLRLIGVPAIRQGNVIDLGVRQLQVVAACSGLRYILSLFALAIVFCYFYQRCFWKAAILFLSLIPAAIVANALRVAGMGVFPALQEGFWHGFSGWLIFVFCFGLLGFFNWLLNYLSPQLNGQTTEETTSKSETSPFIAFSCYTPYLIATLVIVLLTGPFALSAAQAPPVPLIQSFDKFPLQLGSWQGQHVYIDPEMVKATQSSAYLNAEYIKPGHSPIFLWIAYYETQKKAGGFVHSPILCLTGSGWITTKSTKLEVLPGLSVNSMVMAQADNKMLVFYWYLQRGRWVTNEYLNKLFMGYDGLISQRTDGALIRLIAPVVGNDINTAQEHLVDFSRLLVPVLPQFIPD